ncbi:MAG TPA: VCBS repeat-containing protein [Candidatus Acidoferrum sp.]|nr:VCBS repeat-containing protein [Candidatus Acidoferrum sp.]
MPKSYRTAISLKMLAALIFLACTVFPGASRGNDESCAQVLHNPTQNFSGQFSIADFDGDHRPDFAFVQNGQSDSEGAYYWIAFRLSGGSRSSLGISAPWGGVELSSLDVNDDGFLDVIVRTRWTNRPVAVLLNDGAGNFRILRPAAFESTLASPQQFWVLYASGMIDASALLASVFRLPVSSCAIKARSPQSFSRLMRFPRNRSLAFSLLVGFSDRAPPLA